MLEGLSVERRGSRTHEYRAASFAFNVSGEVHAFETGPDGLRYVAVTLPNVLVERVGVDRLLPMIAGRDPMWIGLALRLQREFVRPDDLSSLAVETLALELLLRLAREHRCEAGATPWLRRLNEFCRTGLTRLAI